MPCRHRREVSVARKLSGPPLERHQRMGSMALNELGKMLTAAEVAEMLHLHVNTVKRLGDRGELKYYRVCKRGDRRFLLEAVRRFLDNTRCPRGPRARLTLRPPGSCRGGLVMSGARIRG